MRAHQLSLFAAAAAMFIFPVSQPVSAQEISYALTIKDKTFEPSILQVKAGVKFQLKVTNGSAKQAEFESYELGREKVIAPGATVTIYLGPLEPGAYPFFDDFNQSNIGKIIAK